MAQNKNKQAAGMYFVQAVECKSKGDPEKAVEFLKLALELDPEMVGNAERFFLRDKSFSEAFDQISPVSLFQILNHYKARLYNLYEAIAANAKICTFCEKRKATPGKFIAIFFDVEDEYFGKSGKKTTYFIERIPACTKCEAIVRLFEIIIWGGMFLAGIFGGFLAFRDFISQPKDLLCAIPIAIPVSMAIYGLLVQPVFNFLTWLLYTSAVGEPLLNRMRLFHPPQQIFKG